MSARREEQEDLDEGPLLVPLSSAGRRTGSGHSRHPDMRTGEAMEKHIVVHKKTREAAMKVSARACMCAWLDGCLRVCRWVGLWAGMCGVI